MFGVVGAVFEGQDLHYEPDIVRDSLVLVMTPGLYAKYRHLGCGGVAPILALGPREEGSGTRLAMVASLAKLSTFIRCIQSYWCEMPVRWRDVCLLRYGCGHYVSAITVNAELESGSLISSCAAESSNGRLYVVFNRKRSLFPAALKLDRFLKANAQNFSDEVSVLKNTRTG